MLTRAWWIPPLLLALALIANVSSTPAVDAQESAGGHVVMNFESGEKFLGTVVQQYSKIEHTPHAGGAGLYGRWVIPSGQEKAAVYFSDLPLDLSAFKSFRFRVRRETEASGMLFVRIYSNPKGELAVRVPDIGTEWQTVTVELDRMPLRGPYNPKKPKEIGLYIPSPRAGVYEIDDLELLKEFTVSKEALARSSEDVYTVSDFETPGAILGLDYKGCGLDLVEGKSKGSRQCLRWHIDGSADPAAIYFFDLPRDITEYRSIRFRIRAEKALKQDLAVKLQSGFTNALTLNLKGVGKRWQDVEILLPAMREQGNYCPPRTESLGIFMFRPVRTVLFIDDIRLEKGSTGWRYGEKEQKEVLFGKSRARRAKKITTDHFDIYTDSKAAVSKFPDGLEKAYSFVIRELELPEMEERLPVYIFQSPKNFRDFLVNISGFTKEKAAVLGGIGTARYFATYYQAPESATVVHELSHSLFHRLRGPEGGSWFHEGVARYVEMRWLKKSPAEEFSSRLRGGKYVPLAELLAMGKLFEQGDARGGAGAVDALFNQSAALYEFLIRGPLKDKWANATRVLAWAPVPDSGRNEEVEGLLEMSTGELEGEWLDWGKRPPPR